MTLAQRGAKQQRPRPGHLGRIALGRIADVTTRAADSRGTDRAQTLVTVRYWAAAKHAAGVVEDVVPAATLREALGAVSALHDDRPRFVSVLSVCSYLVGSDPVGSREADSIALENGDVVDVLPPFAGG